MRTVAHWKAWRLRSFKLRKKRPARKLVSRVQKLELLTGLAVGVSLFMTAELEAILLGEGLHLRHYQRLSASAP
jgi:hypothetical protein